MNISDNNTAGEKWPASFSFCWKHEILYTEIPTYKITLIEQSICVHHAQNIVCLYINYTVVFLDARCVKNN